jgi:hypothetical protein
MVVMVWRSIIWRRIFVEMMVFLLYEDVFMEAILFHYSKLHQTVSFKVVVSTCTILYLYNCNTETQRGCLT